MLKNSPEGKTDGFLFEALQGQGLSESVISLPMATQAQHLWPAHSGSEVSGAVHGA